MQRPNILFIISDQHNAKVLGHKNHPEVKTPNLDGMAAEGVRFENAITQNCICTPSRVSFWSGQYCHNHGYYGLSGPNPQGLPNIFSHFRDHGYQSSAVGKIHCPEYWIEVATDNFHETCYCSIDGRSKKYASFLKSRGKLELEDHGGMTEFGDRGIQSMEGRPSQLSFEECQEGWIANETNRFMEESINAGKPFIAMASLPRPHQCTAPCQEFWDMYEGVELTFPPNADWDLKDKAPHMKQTAQQWRTGEWALLEPKNFHDARLRKLRGYLAAVSQVDHAVGVMLQKLKDLNIDDNTIVIYTADHGDYATEHGIMEKAPGICSDAITRIPYIWRWPGQFKSSHVAEELVEAVDAAPTLCKLAGIDPMLTADGVDISELLQGKAKKCRAIAVTEFAWSRSIRKDNFRLVYYPREMFPEEYPNGFGELYDLEQDPWEMHNLYFDPHYGDTIQEIKNEFLNWLIVNTRVTTIHPPTQVGHPYVTRYHHPILPDGKIMPNELRPEYPNYL